MKTQARLKYLLVALFATSLFAHSALAAPQDFDGDGKDDLVTYDASTATFDIRLSSTLENRQVTAGFPGDVPAPLDRNGDGKTDPATFNRSSGYWTFNVNGVVSGELFFSGKPGDIPVPGNYTRAAGDELAVYNPVAKTWITPAGSSTDENAGDIPVPADYDGDGFTDVATWNSKTGDWLIGSRSSFARRIVQFGLPGDIPMPADFDGDGDADLIVFRPYQWPLAESLFYVYNPQDPAKPLTFPWGLPGDVAQTLDAAGDGKADWTVFRAGLGAFFLRTSLLTDFVNLAFSSFNYAAASEPLAPTCGFDTAVPGDANRDHRSDFAVVEKVGAFSVWNFLLLDGNLIRTLFGLADDTLLTGDIEGDKIVQPVAVRKNGGLLDWYFKQSGNNPALGVFGFGLADDTPFLGDLDCDGKDDILVARKFNGQLQWFWRNAGLGFVDFGFSGFWGFDTDTPFVADIDGNGCAEIVVAREVAGAVLWLGWSPLTWETTTYAWGLAEDTPFPPADFDGDGAADPTVIREINGQQVAIVRLGNGTPLVVNLGADGVPAAGYFSGLPKAEFAVYKSGKTYGSDTITLFRYDGVVETISLPQSPGSGTIVAPLVTTVESPLVTASPLGCDETKDFNQPELYKPFSDGAAGHAVVLFDDSFWGKIERLQVFDKENNYIAGVLRAKCCPNGNRAHYWINKRSMTLKPFAPLTVKLTFKDGSTTCRNVPDPTRRYD